MRHIVAEVIEHRSNGVEIRSPVEHHGSRVEQKTIERLIQKYVKLLPGMKKLIGNSFLNDDLKDKYAELITERIDRIME